MKKLFQPILLTLTMASMFFSCTQDKAEDIPSPGVIILGEQESDMEALPVVNNGGTDFAVYDFSIPGPSRVYRFSIGTTYDHGASSSYYYNNRSIFVDCTDPKVEFMGFPKTQRILQCETWSADSITEQTFVYFNEEYPYQCEGNLSDFDELNYNFGVLFPHGTRVDASNAFANFSTMEISKSINSTSVSYDGQTIHTSTTLQQIGFHHLPAPQYLAFRISIGGGEYKYGYVGLEIGDYGAGRVVSCVYEI